MKREILQCRLGVWCPQGERLCAVTWGKSQAFEVTRPEQQSPVPSAPLVVRAPRRCMQVTIISVTYAMFLLCLFDVWVSLDAHVPLWCSCRHRGLYECAL